MRLKAIRTGWLALNWWERTAVMIWTVILVVVCIRVSISPRAHSVFPIFSTAGLHWRLGQELYYPQFFDPQLDVFRYSPLAAAFMTPWSVFSDHVGSVLWRLFNAVLYLGALVWWAKAVLPICLNRTQLALLLLLAVPLSIGCLNNGQSNVLLIGLLLGSTAAVHTGRWNLAAGCMALAVLFKIYPLALGLLFSLIYPKKFGLRFVVALILGLSLPFLLQKSEYVARQYAHWLELMLADNRHERALSDLCSRDLWLVIRLAHLPVSLAGYRFLQALLAGGVAMLCLAGRLAGCPQHRLLTRLFSLGLCWMVLCGPATESCTYILLAPVLAWAVLEAILGQGPFWSRMIPWSSFALFGLSQFTSWVPESFRMPFIGVLPAAGVLLLVGLVEASVRDLMKSSSMSSVQSEFRLARAA
jgi:hypothetical protein